MKQERTFPSVKITKKQERSVRNGHPWIYADEITETAGQFENGCLTDVLSEKGSYLGTGLWSENSLIRIRISRKSISRIVNPQNSEIRRPV